MGFAIRQGVTFHSEVRVVVEVGVRIREYLTSGLKLLLDYRCCHVLLSGSANAHAS